MALKSQLFNVKYWVNGDERACNIGLVKSQADYHEALAISKTTLVFKICYSNKKKEHT